ncbi:MAG: hypothetical protein AAFX93_15080 [Verrucomicrobiota bacterium]
MKRVFTVLFCLVGALLVLSGCANQSGNVSTAATFGAQDFYYVETLPADKRGIDSIIAQSFRERGFKASAGPMGDVPPGATFVVSYEDRWMWDMTMYMTNLKIDIRNRTGGTVAQAESFRPSLQRISPEAMVDETLDEIFKEVDMKYVTPEKEGEKDHKF